MKIRLGIVIPALVIGLGFAGSAARAAGGGSTPRNNDLILGAALVAESRFAEAVARLKQAVVTEPNNADAYNYLGYSHRKLGDRDKALGFYRKALSLAPKHRGANEYLGELYLDMGELAKAEERLEVLDGACFFGCEEYSDLKQAIAAFKAQKGG
jgi:Flp pilus assembly protein TadD